MKKILITGASGFIGGFLVKQALKQGFEVYAGVRESSDLSNLEDPRINFFKMYFASKHILKQSIISIGKFDYIIHNAGVTKTCNNKMFDVVNYKYTRNLIEALYETNLIPKKFIYISSLAAFGPGTEKPIVPISNLSKPNPISQYGISKLKAEEFIKSQRKFPYVILRPTGVYGPGEKDYLVMYKSINKGIETYIGTKEQNISFIYVKDLAKLVLNTLSSNIVKKSYFVSDLNSYTSIELNRIVKKELNKKTITLVFPVALIKIIALLNEKISCLLQKKPSTLNREKFKEISQKNWLCDSNDLVVDFGFKPEYNLQTGIHETIEWCKKENLL